MANLDEAYGFNNTNIKHFNIIENREGINYLSKDTFSSLLSNVYNNLPINVSRAIFDGLKIEIWSADRLDIPQTINGNWDIGDSRFAGLTYSSLKLIKIKSFTKNTLRQFGITTKDQYIKYMSGLISHELGHYFADLIGFNDINSIMRKEWNKIRGIHSTASCSISELIAEDFRLLFGSDGAKGDERGDFIQANKVIGYKQFLERYLDINNYINENKFTKYFNQFRFDYSQDYFGIQFYEDEINPILFWLDHYNYINQDGLWNWNNNEWKYIKRLNV